MGIEPTAFSLARRRSTDELRPQAYCGVSTIGEVYQKWHFSSIEYKNITLYRKYGIAFCLVSTYLNWYSKGDETQLFIKTLPRLLRSLPRN